ncbi:hypothetical protein LTR37_020935 [Vermiconidia calcicola]|uniref:Uncharacterized protein n=1 Tax=Vermiconidia calcicola TaxID=1690605 RepID=A0ACC3MA34_9PEZI|nr:hypothetical protein LTR37_020935 [Vermiconidia calcicola]
MDHDSNTTRNFPNPPAGSSMAASAPPTDRDSYPAAHDGTFGTAPPMAAPRTIRNAFGRKRPVYMYAKTLNLQYIRSHITCCGRSTYLGVFGSIYVTKSDDSAAHGKINPATSAAKDNTVGAVTEGTIVWLLKCFPPQPVATTMASSAGIQAKRS